MNNMDYVVNKVLKVLREDIKKKTNGYDGIGTVKRIDGDIAWVQLDKNNPTLTPVRISGAACKKEDVVRVRVSNGTAFIQGNDTHAPTDDAKANEADTKAVMALDAATEIRAIAEEAVQGNTENVENFTQAIMAINADIENIQEQIDGNITSWFYNVDPAMDRPPVTTDPADPDATGWDTDEKKNNHLGDLYYNVDTGKVWRFVFTNGSFSWSAVEDSDVTRALEMASRAQDTADSKRRVFVATPVVPYDVGDLWVQGSNGDIMRCVQAKTSAGSYSANDWIKASKYTDDSALTTWINGEFATTIQELETGIADAKVETFYQSTNPATNWTAAQKQEHAGDLWYDTSANKYYRYSGSAWEEVKATPPQAVFDRIDGKATIFVGSTTPSNPQAGDLWLKSANDDILTYVNGSWVKYNKYTDNTRANEAYDRASTALTSANGKNKVYHQTSQPSGGTYISGDTWFDTDNGYKMYTYNGTSWVAEQFGNAAIADLSINNAKIANGTIQSAKIAGLDVGKLTGGYIDAAHINVGAITIGQSQVTNLTADLAAKANASSVPTKVSQLTNDSSFATTGQVSTAKTEAINTASSDATTKANNAKTSAINTASADATSKANAAQSAAISAAATDATTKANAAAKTASSYIGFATDGIKIAKNVTSATTYTLIDSEGMTVYKSGNDVASFGDSIRLGRLGTGNNYVLFGSGEINCMNGATLKSYIDYTSGIEIGAYNGASITCANGINLYGNVYVKDKEMFTTFTATGKATISGASGNSGIACTGTVPSGYTPIAVQEITTNHQVIGSINSIELTSKGANVGIRNSGSSSQSFTVTATILCINTGMSVA